ncbi:hypothetical protein [Pedobacter sp. Leaf194]|uniref:hypothetical protein n=1 Tax=Pedobacter sp. Leaf194 TaxID=1736297 RepID=UPI0007031535|nr:hypothetical protein [Pedobacter sp. Leaf194]KQS35895.1 hypothetical protein ASG14_10570 [Pedobacter sp. Leaf194]
MKFVLSLLICILISCTVSAQKKWKYKVKVIENSGKRHRGFFYAAEDTRLVVIKKNADTVGIDAANIDRLFIHRRAIVAPVAIAAAAATAALAIDNPNALETAVIIIIGVPLSVCAGLVVGELFANKRFYKKLQAKDFPSIKANLQKFTVLK